MEIKYKIKIIGEYKHVPFSIVFIVFNILKSYLEAILDKLAEM